MLKGGVSRLVQEMNTSNEIHSQNLIFHRFSCEWSDLASGGTRTSSPYPIYSVTFLKQLAHPATILLTAGNQEAGLCDGDQTAFKPLLKHLIWGL